MALAHRPLTKPQAHVLSLASSRENGVSKGWFRPGYRRRPRAAWWRNLDQLEARGYVARIGDAYVSTPVGDAILTTIEARK